MEEYEREIQEMRERVNRRPLLFEQESQVRTMYAVHLAKFSLILPFWIENVASLHVYTEKKAK